MSCDCCERSGDDFKIYPTEDDNHVLLCDECAEMLRDMVADSPMEGTL